jgi:glucokinase
MRLLADIGGTNARFALQAQADADAHSSGFSDVEVLACSDYPTMDAALAAYLAAARARGMAVDGLRHAAIAIATPVEGDLVAMTNHHWRFSTAALRSAFGLDTLLVVNDFAALAMALPHLGDAGRERVGPTCTAPPDRPLGLIGPGTGLGVSALVPHAGRWIVLPGEGGHASFAPTTKQEIRILETLLEEHGHVSAERLLSGAGLEAIHRVLCGERLAAARIGVQALDGSGGTCRESVDVFCAMLGCVAGNLALTLGATGGMYIGGGIVPRLGRLFHASAFRTRFEAKGRLQPWLARVPTWVVTEPYPALRGVAAMLADHVASRAPT